MPDATETGRRPARDGHPTWCPGGCEAEYCGSHLSPPIVLRDLEDCEATLQVAAFHDVDGIDDPRVRMIVRSTAFAEKATAHLTPDQCRQLARHLTDLATEVETLVTCHG